MSSPNTALFGPQFINDEQNKRSKAQQNASNTSIPLIQNSPVGRYAAPRPMCSMAEVYNIINDSFQIILVLINQSISYKIMNFQKIFS